MSSAAPPDAHGTPAPPPSGAAPTATVPAAASPGGPRARARGWARLTDPAIVLGTALFVVFACLTADTGGGLGGTTPVEMTAILAGGLLVAAAIALAGDGGVPGGWPVALFAAFAAYTALSITWAVDPDGAWLETSRTASYAFAFAGAAALARLSPGRSGRLLGGLLLGLCVVCAYALATKIVPEWLSETERFARLREPFGYWNAIGLAGALAVPAGLWLSARRSTAPAVAALAYPALTLAALTMLLAYSRGSLLAAAAGAAVWFVVAHRRVRGAVTLVTSAAAAAFVAAWTFGQNGLTEDGVELSARSAAGHELLILLAAVLLLVYLAGLTLAFIADLRPLNARQRRNAGVAFACLLALTPAAVAGMLATTDEGLGGSISTAWNTLTDPKVAPPSNDAGRLTETGSIRARYWDDAIRMLEDHELTGFGAGGYATARPRYRRDTIDVEHAHGFVPQTLADLGLLGMGLATALLVAWLLAARRAIRAATGQRRTALVTLAAIATVFGVHSLVDWTWFTPGTALVGMLAAGWVAGAAAAPRGSGSMPRRLRWAFAAAAAALALTTAWSAWQPLRSEQASERVLDLTAVNRIAEARDEARRAADLNPLSAEPYLSLAIAERRAGDLAAAERALERAVDVEPSQYETWLRLAEFQLWVADQPERALRSVRAALYLNPASFTVIQRYLDIARTVRNRGG